MTFHFDNVDADGDLNDRWDVLLRIVGDFWVEAEDRIVYSESEFCLVEFAAALAKWLAVATEAGPDFAYTSLESEVEGLVKFTALERGQWTISSAADGARRTATSDLPAIRDASRAYVSRLRMQLLPGLDIFKYFEDEAAVEAVRSVE